MNHDTLPNETFPAQPAEPCHHMTNLVSAYSDDTLKGPARWYTQFHVATCPKCRAALHELQQLKEHLHQLDAEERLPSASCLSTDRQEKLVSALEQIDTKSP